MMAHSYLIIAGATKAGSTSLFHYLADHPEICASDPKETRFFLDADYPLFARYRYEDGLDKYQVYFPRCKEQLLRLDGSPQYLYSQGSAQKIKFALPNVKLLFILREPIDRLLSYYRFAKQKGHMPVNVSFEEYVSLQFQYIEQGRQGKEHMRALEHGRYSRYLKAYFDLFESDQILILRFDTLKRDPVALLEETCHFAGIDSTFFHGSDTRVFNRSMATRSVGLHLAYQEFRRRLSDQLHAKQWLWRPLRSIHRWVWPLFLRLNSRPADPVLVSDSVRTRLEEYYADEPTALGQLLGCDQFSWNTG